MSDHAPPQVIVYCDESGSSGPNYLDLDQPFFVVAGWVTPEAPSINIKRSRANQNVPLNPTPIVAAADTPAAQSNKVVLFVQNRANRSTKAFPAIVAEATKAATIPEIHTASG